MSCGIIGSIFHQCCHSCFMSSLCSCSKNQVFVLERIQTAVHERVQSALEHKDLHQALRVMEAPTSTSREGRREEHLSKETRERLLQILSLGQQCLLELGPEEMELEDRLMRFAFVTHRIGTGVLQDCFANATQLSTDQIAQLKQSTEQMRELGSQASFFWELLKRKQKDWPSLLQESFISKEQFELIKLIFETPNYHELFEKSCFGEVSLETQEVFFRLARLGSAKQTRVIPWNQSVTEFSLPSSEKLSRRKGGIAFAPFAQAMIQSLGNLGYTTVGDEVQQEQQNALGLLRFQLVCRIANVRLNHKNPSNEQIKQLNKAIENLQKMDGAMCFLFIRLKKATTLAQIQSHPQISSEVFQAIQRTLQEHLSLADSIQKSTELAGLSIDELYALYCIALKIDPAQINTLQVQYSLSFWIASSAQMATALAISPETPQSSRESVIQKARPSIQKTKETTYKKKVILRNGSSDSSGTKL